MASISNPFETDEVVGVTTAEQSAALRKAARDEGFDAEIVCDPDKIDVDGQSSDTSMFDRVLRFFQEGEEKDALRAFRDRLVQGDHVVRIIGLGDRADEAGRLMAAHDADLVWHYGRWTFTPLHKT